jgi:hypothetical protein
VKDEVAIHRTATVEPGALLKPPLIIGAGDGPGTCQRRGTRTGV